VWAVHILQSLSLAGPGCHQQQCLKDKHKELFDYGCISSTSMHGCVVDAAVTILMMPLQSVVWTLSHILETNCVCPIMHIRICIVPTTPVSVQGHLVAWKQQLPPMQQSHAHTITQGSDGPATPDSSSFAGAAQHSKTTSMIRISSTDCTYTKIIMIKPSRYRVHELAHLKIG